MAAPSQPAPTGAASSAAAAAVAGGGAAVNPFSTPRQVRIANKYVVLEKIGSGAFGDIYSGRAGRQRSGDGA